MEISLVIQFRWNYHLVSYFFVMHMHIESVQIYCLLMQNFDNINHYCNILKQ